MNCGGYMNCAVRPERYQMLIVVFVVVLRASNEFSRMLVVMKLFLLLGFQSAWRLSPLGVNVPSRFRVSLKSSVTTSKFSANGLFSVVKLKLNWRVMLLPDRSV